MAKRLTRIDDLSRSDHYYLDPSDKCLFYGEYTAYAGYSESCTNQLIFNLKKSVQKSSHRELQYKERDIKKVGRIFSDCLADLSLNGAVAFVPMPPSKARDDPEYDDRMERVLWFMAHGHNTDIRCLLEQAESTAASHLSGDDRIGVEQLYQNYHIRTELLDSLPDKVAVVDDMLTTGAHFKAAQRLINEHAPHTEVVGLFVARRRPK